MPRAPRPNAWLKPTTISRARRSPSSTSCTYVSASTRENSAVKGMTRHTSGPSSAMRSSRSSSGSSPGGASVGRRTARGFGSNVTATGRTESARARSTAVRITAWWPRWMPSNVPWATTLGGASGGYWSRPRTIRMEEAQRAQPLRRQLADARRSSRRRTGGMDPEGRGRASLAELGLGNGLPVAEPSAALGRDRRRRQVGDRAVGRQDAAPERRGVARLDHRPRHGVLETERAHARARERLDVAPAPERLAEVRGQAADVRARPARHADTEARAARTRGARTRQPAPGGAPAPPRCRPARARGGAFRPRAGRSTSAAPARSPRRTGRAPPAPRRPRGAARAARPSRRRSRRGCPSPRRAGWWRGTPCPGPGDTRSAWSPPPGGSGGARSPWGRACPRGRPWARGVSAEGARPPGTT